MSDHYEYSTSDMAKYYGLSAKGLAYYEKEGIISPVRKKESTYRIYTLDDCYCLYHTKLYRNNGLAIKKTADLLRENDLYTILDSMEQQQTEEEKRVQIQNQIIEKTRWIMDLLKDYEEYGQQFSIEMSPVFNRLFIRTFEFSHISTKEESEEFQKWNESIPLNTASLLYKKDMILSGENLLNVNIGNIMEEKDNTLIQLEKSDRVTVYDSRLCLKTILKGNSNDIDKIDWLQSSLTWMKEHNYEIDGDILTQMLLVTGEKNNRVRYDLAWIPVREMQ